MSTGKKSCENCKFNDGTGTECFKVVGKCIEFKKWKPKEKRKEKSQ